MAEHQENPPDPDFPAWSGLRKWCKALVKWVHGHRPVAGLGISITDAPGGGQLISANAQQVSLPPMGVQTISGSVAGVRFKADVYFIPGTYQELGTD